MNIKGELISKGEKEQLHNSRPCRLQGTEMNRQSEYVAILVACAQSIELQDTKQKLEKLNRS